MEGHKIEREADRTESVSENFEKTHNNHQILAYSQSRLF